MNDRQKLGYKGPVWKVTEEWLSANQTPKEMIFDYTGNVIGVAHPDVEEHEDEDGGRTVLRRVLGFDLWSMEGLNGVGFPTRGAATTITTFNPKGTPVHTLCRSESNDELSYVCYVCDERGRIVEATQHNRGWPILPDGFDVAKMATNDELASLREFIGPGSETRVIFRYDDSDRVAEQTRYVAGCLDQRIVSTYNENGDLLTFAQDEEQPYRFEYEYDNWGNWTRKVVRHPLGSVEFRRHITYYDESGPSTFPETPS